MVQAIRAFLEFCYIAQCNVIYEKSLHDLRYALNCFHQYHEIFQEVGVCDNFSLPHQHSLTHYESLIRLFGAPNGVSTSITESKHIVAVKKTLAPFEQEQCPRTNPKDKSALVPADRCPCRLRGTWYVDATGAAWYTSMISLFCLLTYREFHSCSLTRSAPDTTGRHGAR